MIQGWKICRRLFLLVFFALFAPFACAISDNGDSTVGSTNATNTNYTHNVSAFEVDLWSANRALSLQQFYEKYRLEFEPFGVNLTFAGEDLIDASGKRLNPLVWGSELEKKLAIESGNAKKAKNVSLAYLELIHPLIQNNPTLIDSFQRFLLRYNVYLGANPEYVRKRLFIYENFQSFFESGSNGKILNQFLEKVSQSFERKAKKKASKKRQVVIVARSDEGMSLAAAEVASAQLKNDPSTQVKIIDECVDLSDAVFTATGGRVRSCQLTFESERSATLFRILNAKLGEYILPKHFEDLAEQVSAAVPDEMISTVQHVEGIIALAYELVKPLTVMITGYEFPEEQWYHLNHVDPELLQYAVSSTNENFFRRMIRSYSSNPWDQELARNRIERLKSRLFSKERPVFHDLIESLGVFRYVPYPVAPHITPPRDADEILISRQALGLSTESDQKVVSVVYSNETELDVLIQKIFKVSGQLSYPIQLVIASRGNREKNSDPSRLFGESESPSRLTFKVLGGLSSEEMAKLYRASDLVIGQSDAQTTVELIASQTYFVRGFKLLPKDVENGKYLESLALSLPTNTDKAVNGPLEEDLSDYLNEISAEDLQNQLNELLERPRRMSKVRLGVEAQKMIDLISTLALSAVSAERQISLLSELEKKVLAKSYLEYFNENASALDLHAELKFNQFLRTLNLMFPEKRVFSFFVNWGMRNIVDVEGMTRLIQYFEQKEEFHSLQGNVLVMKVESLREALTEMSRNNFVGQKTILIQHRWAHFTPLFLERKESGDTRIVVSDSGAFIGGHPWAREIQKEVNSSDLNPVQMFAFEKGRQADLMSCPIFTLSDTLENSRSSIFNYLDFLLREHSMEVKKAPKDLNALDNLSVITWHPENFMKTSQSISLIQSYNKAVPVRRGFLGAEGKTLNSFIDSYTEPSIVAGKLKGVNYYTRKTAFEHFAILLNSVLNLE